MSMNQLPALAPQAALPGAHGQAPVTGPRPQFLGNFSQEQKLELLELWRSVAQRRWAILGLALGVAILAAVISMAMTPIYRATALVLIEAGRGKIVSVEEVTTVSQQREHYQTQVEIIKSREVAMRAVKALKLWNHPLFDPRLEAPSWTKRTLAALGIGDKIEGRDNWTDAELTEQVVRALQKELTVSPVRLSQLVKVEFESSDKELAAKVANTVAEQYIALDRDERYRLTQQVSQQLQERLASLREKLVASERALQDYRESKGIVAIGGSAQANSTQQVGSLTEKLLQARSRRMELESTYQQARGTPASGYGSIPAVVRDGSVNDAQRQLITSQSKLAELQQRLGPAHEQVKQATAEVNETRSILAERQAAVVRSVMREYEVARDTEVAIERSLNTARGAVQTVNREEFQLAVLEREYQSNRQLFDMFMNRAKETSLIGDVQASVARVADAAIPPHKAIKPNKPAIVLVAALLALLLGALAAIALDRIDNTIKGTEDAENRLHVPVLAALPLVPKATRKAMVRAFIEDAHSHFSEGIRTARTGVMLSNLDAPNRILLVTSSLPGEGKTTVSINLAIAHSQTARTLLVDCDMRRAQVSHSLGLSAAPRGLTNLVAGQATIDECVVPVKNTQLYALPVGILPPNPLELMLSKRFKDTLAQLAELYDVIVIDSPPVELVSEALVLAPMATSVAVVVKAMSTPAPLVRKTQQRLQRAGGNLLGVVVNGLDFKKARAYYGEYGHSTYGYGTYGSSKHKGKNMKDARDELEELDGGPGPTTQIPLDYDEDKKRRAA